MKHFEPKDFGLLDWVHYTVLVVVYILTWQPIYDLWASFNIGFGSFYLTAITMVVIIAIADKFEHYVLLPFLAKLMKQ